MRTTKERIDKVADYHTPELIEAIKAGNVDNPEEIRELVVHLIEHGILIGVRDSIGTVGALDTSKTSFERHKMINDSLYALREMERANPFPEHITA